MLIEQSIAKQYGVIPSKQGDLKYADWAKMVSGLMEDTPLGRIVQIRAETDRDTLKRFTPDQKRIRREWQQFRANQMRRDPAGGEAWKDRLKELEHMFASAFGKKGGG